MLEITISKTLISGSENISHCKSLKNVSTETLNCDSVVCCSFDSKWRSSPRTVVR